MDLSARDRRMHECYQIPGWMWPVEMGWLYDRFAKSKVHIEVGVFCGKSMWATTGGMSKDAKFYGIDLFEPWDACPVPTSDWIYKIAVELAIATGPKVELLKMDSISAARHLLKELGPKSVDSIFLDGNHYYAEVCAEIEEFGPLLKDDGILAGHDYSTTHLGVMEAVHDKFPNQHVVHPYTRIWERCPQ